MTDAVYVVERFPERSQTFIHNELRALRRLGVEPQVFALYPAWDLDDAADDLPFQFLGSAVGQPLRTVGAAMRVARRHPMGLARAVALAARRPSRFQAHALAKALLLVDLLVERPKRIHAHFARASASTAMLAATIVGTRFSFTAHALDVFQDPFDVDRKLRRADVTITVCDYNARYLAEHWPGLGRVVVIPCGVDIATFDPARHREPDVPMIVAVGRLVPKKGFDDLLRAVALLRDGGTQMRCTILGDGPERSSLEETVRALGLEGVVDLTGSVPSKTVRAALEGATVFCLPCVVAADGDRDSQPVVVKEAMATGLPVVGTTEVAMPEMVDAAVGRLVPPHDPPALAAALAEVLAMSPAARGALGSAARRRVKERFALDPLVAEVGGVLGLTRTGAGGLPRRP